MARSSPVGSAFRARTTCRTPPGCDGWEEMYPYYALFDEGRREADEQRFGSGTRCSFPLPMPAFDAICIDTAYQALGSWQNRVFAVPPAMGIDYRCINGYIYISGQPGHRSREDRRARRALPGAGWSPLRELGRSVRRLAREMEGADRGARRAAGAHLPTRARRGCVRRPGDELLRRPRLLPSGHTARRPDVAEPLQVPAARLRRYVTFADSAKRTYRTSPDQHIAQMVAGLDVLLFGPTRSSAGWRVSRSTRGWTRRSSRAGRRRRSTRISPERGAQGSWLMELEAVTDPWFHMATGDGPYHYYGGAGSTIRRSRTPR